MPNNRCVGSLPLVTSMSHGNVFDPAHTVNTLVLSPRGRARPPAESVACSCFPLLLVTVNFVKGLYTSYDALACWYAQASADIVRCTSTTGGRRSAAAIALDSKNASPSVCCFASRARTIGHFDAVEAAMVVVAGRVVNTLALPGVGVDVYANAEVLLLYANVTLYSPLPGSGPTVLTTAPAALRSVMVSVPPILNIGDLSFTRVQRTRNAPGLILPSLGNTYAFESSGPLSSCSLKPARETADEPVLWSSTQSCLFGQALEVPLSAISLITTVLLVGAVVVVGLASSPVVVGFDPHAEYGKQTVQAETDAGQVVLPVFASHSPLTSSKHGAAWVHWLYS